MIIFENSGTLDYRLITTMGVNVKESDSAIGYFGTGLKYAIAVLLRTGHEVRIFTGDRVYTFATEKASIRGKEFQFITMDFTGAGADIVNSGTFASVATKQTLGFTTELGKNWEVWQAYRELWSNVKDEGGVVMDGAEYDRYNLTLSPSERSFTGVSNNFTRIEVHGPDIDRVHQDRGTFLLEGVAKTTLNVTSGGYNLKAELYPNGGTRIFFRGIKVYDLPKPTAYTYNFLSHLELTEDRTAKYPWQFDGWIKSLIVNADDNVYIMDSTLRGEETFEGSLAFSLLDGEPGQAFMDVMEAQEKNVNLNPQARMLYFTTVAKRAGPLLKELSPVQKKMVDRAAKFLLSMGYNLSKYPLKVVDSLGAGVMGMAKGGEIWLSEIPFSQGTKEVAATLLEEYLHLEYGFVDNSRSMQNWLLMKVVSLGEELGGEPL